MMDARFYMTVGMIVVTCAIVDVLVKFATRNFEDWYRHPKKANGLKFQLQHRVADLKAAHKYPRRPLEWEEFLKDGEPVAADAEAGASQTDRMQAMATGAAALSEKPAFRRHGCMAKGSGAKPGDPRPSSASEATRSSRAKKRTKGRMKALRTTPGSSLLHASTSSTHLAQLP
eukprot:SAG22_NODE_530_length_9427_cov_3.306818_5_plen_173_part_00